MFKNIHISKLYLIVSVVTTIMILILFSTSIFYIQYKHFKKDTKEKTNIYLNHQKDLLKLQISEVVDYINYEHNKILPLIKESLKNESESFSKTLSLFYEEKKWDYTDENAIKTILEFVEKSNFGRKIKFKFQKGSYKQNYFTETVTENNIKRVIHNYVKKTEELDINLITYAYYDDFENEAKTNILNYISKIRFGNTKDGYIFVVTYDGVTLVNDNQKEIIGKNIWEFTDSRGVKVIQEERKAVKNKDGDFIRYHWIKPTTQKETEKISFIKGFDKWKWMIGSGRYLDDLEVIKLENEIEFDKRIKTEVLIFLLITVFVFMLSFALVLYFYKKITNEFNNFYNLFEKAIMSNSKININALYIKELVDLSDIFNTIFEEQDKFGKVAKKMIHEGELRYRFMFENMMNGVLVLQQFHNDDFIIVDINPYGEKTDKVKKEKIIGKNINELYIKINEYGLLEKIKKVNKTSLPEFMYPSFYSDERIKGWRENYIYKLASGEIIVIYNDVTERKDSEEETLKHRKLESIGVLAGGIAHDFNNFLTSILGNISLAKIQTDTANKELCDILDKAEKATIRAQKLTQQLLTFSKGGEPIKKEISIIETLKDTSVFALRGSNIKLEFNIKDNLWDINADDGQITQVISNLVINARQAMESGGKVTITAENTELDRELILYGITVNIGSYVKISISDEGSGISKENLSKIFDPYFTTKKTGNGLGLTTVYSIIKKHKGYIFVTSQIGIGTTFHIYIPALKNQNKPVSDIIEIKKDEKITNQSPKTILLMDDDEMILNTTSKILKYLKYNVLIAKNGEETLDLYEKSFKNNNKIDLLIIDLTIQGGMGGEETIKKLTEFDKNVKAIVSSGYSNNHVMANYKLYGFKGVIVKPYKIEDLANTINEIINKGDN